MQLPTRACRCTRRVLAVLRLSHRRLACASAQSSAAERRLMLTPLSAKKREMLISASPLAPFLLSPEGKLCMSDTRSTLCASVFETENPAKGHFEKCVFSRAPESSVLHLPLDELARASEIRTRLSQHQRVLYVCGVLWPPRSGGLW